MKKRKVSWTMIEAQLMENSQVSVRIAGAAYGLSKNVSYAAVKRGEIKSKRIGGKIICPTAPIRKDLGIDRTKKG